MNKNKSNKRGFTLIELIVVMAVIGILVLLAAPKFIGYTRKAELVKLQHNIKVVEDAAEIYHMNNEDWPRLTDVPYSAEELQGLAEKYLDETGEVLQLDPDGNYYNIDWEKMKPYIKKPHDAELFVLQNPVGEVFYMEDLTPKGQERIDELQGIEVVKEESYFTYSIETDDATADFVVITAFHINGEFGNLATLTDVIIPSEMDGIAVTQIAPYAFEGAGLNSITIPEGIVFIGDYAFSENNLTHVYLPDSMLRVSDNAFANNQIESFRVRLPFRVDGGQFLVSNQISRLAFTGNPVLSIEILENENSLLYSAYIVYFEDRKYISFSGSGTYNYVMDIDKYEMVGKEVWEWIKQ